MRLTDISIRALQIPDEGAVIFYDDVVSGFGVRVSGGGTKSFVLTYGPRRHRETIGRVGIISLHEARVEAKRRLSEYTLGKTKPRTITWNAALEEYLAEVKANCKPRTHEHYSWVLKRYFRYGDTRLADLSPHELHKSLERLAPVPAMRQRAFGTVRAFVRWAYCRHYFDRNPMERMREPRAYVPRARILDTAELRFVWNAAGDDTFGQIVRLLILTGQRRGEITCLTPEMVGPDTICFPAYLTKNSREHVIPLGPMAKRILDTVPRKAFCCFPALGRTTPFNGFSKCKPKLERRAGVYGWTLHDLRRTFASGMAAQGVQLPVIEKLLNHVSGSFGGIVGVYQRYDFMPEMREAITKWESHVQRLITPGQSVECWP